MSVIGIYDYLHGNYTKVPQKVDKAKNIKAPSDIYGGNDQLKSQPHQRSVADFDE
jgi:hypothetical protein